MKKFLFTLAALLMASSAFAIDLTSTDLEITSEMIGKQQLLPINVVLNDEYVNGWEMTITYPEGVTAGNPKKNTAVLNQYVPNADGDDEVVTPLGDCLANRIVQAYGTAGYWDSDGDGTYESYGAVKIGPTGTFKLYDLRVTPNEGFTGGDIVIEWMINGGFDHRNGQTGVGNSGTLTIHLTVPAAQPAPAPTIKAYDDVVTAAVEGDDANHTVELYIVNADGTRTKVSNPYTVTKTYEVQKITFVAVTIANEDESGNTECEPVVVTIPALDKNDVDSPSIQGMTGENGTYYIIIAPAVLGKGLEVEWEADPTTTNYTVDENGIVTLIYNRGAEDVPVYVLASTKATTEYNASDVADATITVPALPQVKTPEINYVVNGDGTFTVTATCETEGATIVLKDKDGNIVTNPATVNYDPYVGYNGTWTATATAPYYRPSETGSKLIEIGATDKIFVASPSIVGMSDEDGIHFTISIIPGTTDGQLIYTAEPMGTLMRAATVNIQYERKAEDYYVDVDAYTTEGATYAESEHATDRVRVPALPQTAKPSVTYSYENGKLNVWAYGSDDDAVYTLYCDGVEYTGEMPITYDIYAGYGPHTWTATAIAPNKTVSDVSDPVEITIAKEPKVYEADAPVISDPVITDDAYTYTVTGDGTIEVKVTTYDEEGNPVVTTTTGEKSVTVVIPRTDETQYVNIVATNTPAVPEGYDSVLPGQDSKMYEEIEAKPEVPVTAAPDATFDEGVSTYVYLYDEDGNVIIAPDGKPAAAVDENGNRIIDENGHWKSISFVNMDEDAAVIEYSLDGGKTWYTWDNKPIVFNENGQYVVLARATANGKETSDVAEFVVVVTPATSVNELVNGKTVAGVRYFNMAGQEMQEANGITIVVTTYTDGTTSAVKVIK